MSAGALGARSRARRPSGLRKVPDMRQLPSLARLLGRVAARLADVTQGPAARHPARAGRWHWPALALSFAVPAVREPGRAVVALLKLNPNYARDEGVLKGLARKRPGRRLN